MTYAAISISLLPTIDRQDPDYAFHGSIFLGPSYQQIKLNDTSFTHRWNLQLGINGRALKLFHENWLGGVELAIDFTRYKFDEVTYQGSHGELKIFLSHLF